MMAGPPHPPPPPMSINMERHIQQTNERLMVTHTTITCIAMYYVYHTNLCVSVCVPISVDTLNSCTLVFPFIGNNL